jgi:hypothetical protein
MCQHKRSSRNQKVSIYASCQREARAECLMLIGLAVTPRVRRDAGRGEHGVGSTQVAAMLNARSA